MAVNNVQKLSFLGGLVSPSLYLRSDLEKFGKWFSTADNIRFNTIGSLENRPGTVHMATTKENLSGRIIKLIKFVYNSNESCLLELGTNYCRVYKGTEYKTEFYTEIDPNADGDIKYAQSGDTIFIATSRGLYEIIRTNIDFTAWSFRKFNWNKGITPLDEENDDDTKTITLTRALPAKSFTLNLFNKRSQNYFFNPTLSFTIAGVLTQVYTYTGKISYSDFVTAVNTNLSSTYKLTAAAYNQNSSNTYIKFTENNGQTTTVEQIKITYRDYTNPASVSNTAGWNTYTINSDSIVFSITFYLDDYGTEYETVNISEDITSISELVSYVNNHTIRDDIKIEGYQTSNGEKWKISVYKYVDGSWTGCRALIEYYPMTSYTTFANPISQNSSYYTVSSSFNFFSDKQDDEIFSIRNTINASNIRASYDGSNTQYSLNNGTNTTTVQTFLTDGNWRYNSSGLWNGVVNLYYSKDNGTTWIKFFTRSNDGSTSSSITNGYSTVNDNTSGFIETGDLVLMKIEATITWQNTNSKFIAELACKQFDINSYYKIINVDSSNYTTALVENVRNDVGEITSSADWRESVFSASKGYPTAIGFYQNRLFLGKDYILYGSATDDFWDFYEPVAVKDSDPVTMSLLGYQVDTIQNIITMRSFFVFTTGGEFGIGSEGALTQADKYLKQLSAHGSNECNPIFCGDIVVFVDSSGNTVRAFQYSLDVDSYEATDVSVLIEQILKGKTIKTTEYLKHSKECLFLTTDGEVYVFKFYQEQNIAAWSVWKHAKYTITNLCVVPSSNNTEILYIACDTDYGKVIEKFDASLYCDSLHTYTADTATDTFTTDFEKGDIVVVDDGTDSNYLVTIGDDKVLTTRNNTTSVTAGLRYKSIATVLSPEIQQQDGTFTTFHKKRPFRVHLFYRDSYGFKVGVEDYDTQEVQYQEINAFIDQENELTSGKANVLVPARFDGNSRVTFVQEEPYPMHIENILIETDYGGK